MPKAGAEYFNGAGKCTTCHSATGDLAGLAGKYETVDIQQRMLSLVADAADDEGAAAAQRRAGYGDACRRSASVSGALVYMDDFVVTLQDQTRRVAHVQADAGAQGAENRSARRASCAARDDHRQEYSRPRRVSGDLEMKRVVAACARRECWSAVVLVHAQGRLDPAKLLKPADGFLADLQRRLFRPPLQHPDQDQAIRN